MNSLKSTENEEPCILYPWNISDNGENFKANFQNHYLDHMSNLNINSSVSSNTLTRLACGVLPDVTKEQIEKFCEKGVSMVVFSFNGLSRELCRKMVNEIRLGIFNFSLEKNDRIPYSMALVLNLDGIGFRTGSVSSTKDNKHFIELSIGGHVFVTNDEAFKNNCTENRIYVSCKNIQRLKENDRIYLDYRSIELAVKRVDPDELYCVIIQGGYLMSLKSVHIPGIPTDTKMFSEKDEEYVRIGIELKVDIILVPGVRNAKFLDRVKKFVCEEHGADIDLYAKIDNSVGLKNIEEIIKSADGVFLHRLNLCMDVGDKRIVLVQKIVLSKCHIMGKPSITYGGFLNSMESSTIALGSEVNDIITTVLDGTDCIYLDVTKRSVHKVHCVQFALTVCRQAEVAIWQHQRFSDLKNKSKPTIDPAYAFSIGCVEVSMKCKAAAIIVITSSGMSAKIIARYRPMCPVLAVLRHGKCARKISVWRNLISLHYIDPIETVWSKDVENRTKLAMKFAKKKGILNQGDLVLHMKCSKQNAGFTNNMSMFYVTEEDLVD